MGRTGFAISPVYYAWSYTKTPYKKNLYRVAISSFALDLRSQWTSGAVCSCLRHLRPFILYQSKKYIWGGGILYQSKKYIWGGGYDFKGHCHRKNWTNHYLLLFISTQKSLFKRLKNLWKSFSGSGIPVTRILASKLYRKLWTPGDTFFLFQSMRFFVEIDHFSHINILFR